MIDEKSYDAFALQLFGLENIDVQSIKVLRSGNDIIIDIFGSILKVADRTL